ncbi:MAG: class I SAM-dependent methyltransferase [Myxococcales bacterium]|nr:class I SAM-dependent methyltransferase [Myxococcales bacterium]
MPDESEVSSHYTQGDLLERIRAGVDAVGKTPEEMSVDDLAPVDEFHIGGRQASEDFLSQLNLDAMCHVLDVGCGLGGASRFVATRFGARVTGIDLTPEYIAVGEQLCRWLGLEERIALHVGSALACPFPGESFDAAYMMHVGMNIEDKAALFRELARVLRPGARLGVYDVMRTGPGELVFPVPWASSAAESAVATPDAYRAALESAGFKVSAERNRREFAIAFFEALAARAGGASGPPPLGLHLVMGKDTPIKVANVMENIRASRIAPVELVAVRSE